jgi:hypothetical protein
MLLVQFRCCCSDLANEHVVPSSVSVHYGFVAYRERDALAFTGRELYPPSLPFPSSEPARDTQCPRAQTEASGPAATSRVGSSRPADRSGGFLVYRLRAQCEPPPAWQLEPLKPSIGACRKLGCGPQKGVYRPAFTLCSRREVRSRRRAAGSARARSTGQQSRSPCIGS